MRVFEWFEKRKKQALCIYQLPLLELRARVLIPAPSLPNKPRSLTLCARFENFFIYVQRDGLISKFVYLRLIFIVQGVSFVALRTATRLVVAATTARALRFLWLQ